MLRDKILDDEDVRKDNLIFMVGGLLIIVVLLAVLVFSGVIGILINTKEVKAEITDYIVSIDDISFKGNPALWKNNTKLHVGTSDGAFVYPESKVTYHQVDNDSITLAIMENEGKIKEVQLYVGTEHVSEIQAKYEEAYKEEIVWETE